MIETKRDVLEHPSRRELLEAAMDASGLATAKAADVLDVNVSTARYHLKRLEQMGLVRSRHAGGRLFWFPTGQDLPLGLDEQATLAVGRTRDVFEAIRENPGTGLTELADQLGAYPSLVHPVVDRLVEAGLVERERDGRRVSLVPRRRVAPHTATTA